MLTLAATLWAPGVAWGRQTERELVQHLDSLMPLLEEAKVEAAAAHKAREKELEASQPTQAVDIGLLHVLVVPGQAEAARDVVGTVWDRDYAPFVDRSPSLERGQIFFRWAVDAEPYTASSFRIRTVDARRWRSRAHMEGLVRGSIGASLMDDVSGTRLQERWGIFTVTPPSRPDDLYRRMVVAPSAAVRECLEGDADRCLVALGLDDDGYLIDDWYDADERRLLVTRQIKRFGLEGEGPEACMDGSRQACDAVLRDYSGRYSETRWASPVDLDVHSSMLWYALQQGGAGAWGRLLDHADDDPLSALQAASGLDGQALAEGWRAWLLESRPTTHAGSGSLAVGALFWFLLLITFAARSTRWRLG
jgi:hypothetical protein